MQAAAIKRRAEADKLTRRAHALAGDLSSADASARERAADAELVRARMRRAAR